tara:strand:- start:8129 stop:8614 length:486 start_codon:yes stop_codon:yes gene_type:complete
MYHFSKGPYSRLTSGKVREYVARIEYIRKEAGTDGVTPAMVVKDAKDPSSPLHDAFEWDVEVAAYHYQLHQARNLLNHVRYRRETKQEPKSIKVYHGNVETPVGRRYVHQDVIAQNPDYHQQVIQMALQQAKLWQARYSEYQQLAPILDAIKQVEETLAVE